MLNPQLPFVEQLHRQFFDAKPFKHISIDNFLAPELAQQLLDQFPRFDPERAKNEMGKVGGKATQENIRALGSAYKQFDDFFSSPDFLSYLSRLTGIPNLLFDSEYFGGGTHDNLHGQELDVHVDFNYHRSTKLHRRLNLIVYLNHDWDPEWGGNIEMHSDPRNPEKNSIISFAPLFNRCVIFETNEYSWHGFSEIRIPEDKRHLSRKSMTIYYYTKSRPDHEVVPVHNTFYIQRPIPADIKAGQTLSAEQLRVLKGLIGKRDTWIYFYQNLELRLNGEITNLKHLLSEIESTVRPNLLGYISQNGKPTGYYPDRWIAPLFESGVKAHRPVTGLSIEMRMAQGLSRPAKLQFLINEKLAAESVLQAGQHAIVNVPCTIAAQEDFTLAIRSDAYFCPQQMGINSDERHLVCLVEYITAQH